MTVRVDAQAASDLYVYWCPKCQRQTEKPWHTAYRGHALIPQNDEEHYCERIPVVPAAQLEAAEAERDELLAALTDEAAGYGTVMTTLAYYIGPNARTAVSRQSVQQYERLKAAVAAGRGEHGSLCTNGRRS